MIDLSLKDFLNINQNRNNNKKEVKDREDLYLKYDARARGELFDNYLIKSKLDNKKLRKDGCVIKKVFE